jgi:hypothetical protein
VVTSIIHQQNNAKNLTRNLSVVVVEVGIILLIHVLFGGSNNVVKRVILFILVGDVKDLWTYLWEVRIVSVDILLIQQIWTCVLKTYRLLAPQVIHKVAVVA